MTQPPSANPAPHPPFAPPDKELPVSYSCLSVSLVISVLMIRPGTLRAPVCVTGEGRWESQPQKWILHTSLSQNCTTVRILLYSCIVRIVYSTIPSSFPDTEIQPTAGVLVIVQLLAFLI